MKIEYKDPDILARIDQAIAQAQLDEQAIDCIRLSRAELEEFCELRGFAFSKECGYYYKGFRVAYDWGVND